MSLSDFPNYCISKLRLEALLGMATAPHYTPGGFPITLNTRSDNRSDNTTDDRSNEQPGQRITIENADEHLHWLPEYSVIVCSVHKYAIRNVATHLRDSHCGTKKQRQAVVDAYSKFVIRDPKNVPLPSPLRSPLSILGKPLLAFICGKPECERISISRDEMRKHCNRTHDWESSKEDREHWHRVWAQTFFKSAGLQKYFTVDHTEQEQDGCSGDEEEASIGQITAGTGEMRQSALDEIDLSGVYGEWDAAVDRHQETLEVADAEVAKTDHTLWFKRTQWAEHLAGCNLKHLSRASRLPDREEQVL
jgi:hypothetical protein